MVHTKPSGLVSQPVAASGVGVASGASVVSPTKRSEMIVASSIRLDLAGSRVRGSELLPYSRQTWPFGQDGRWTLPPWQPAKARPAARIATADRRMRKGRPHG